MSAPRPRYRVLEHTADTGIIARGATVEAVFENAAYAMFDLVFDLAGVEPTVPHRVVAEGDTPEEIMVAWLSELLAIAEIEGLAFFSFVVEVVEGREVRGWASGTPAADLELRGPPIKAVTHHEAAVGTDATGWWARLIFDV